VSLTQCQAIDRLGIAPSLPLLRMIRHS
jgi:hypothetical protein